MQRDRDRYQDRGETDKKRDSFSRMIHKYTEWYHPKKLNHPIFQCHAYFNIFNPSSAREKEFGLLNLELMSKEFYLFEKHRCKNYIVQLNDGFSIAAQKMCLYTSLNYNNCCCVSVYCGICHTDVHFSDGSMTVGPWATKWPIVPGHELAGVATKVRIPPSGLLHLVMSWPEWPPR